MAIDNIYETTFFHINSTIRIVNSDKTFFDGVINNVLLKCIGIIIDVNQENYRLLSKKENIKFIYVQQETAMMYKAEIIDYKLNDKFQFILLSTPQIVNKIERRRYQRVNALLSVKYSFLSSKDTFTEKSQVPVSYFRKMNKTFSVDISVGGLSIITDCNNDEAKQVLVTIKLNEEEITALCDVVRFETKDGKNNKLALKFIDITNKDIETIMNYVNSKL